MRIELEFTGAALASFKASGMDSGGGLIMGHRPRVLRSEERELALDLQVWLHNRMEDKQRTQALLEEDE